MCMKMNEILNKFLLVGDKFMPEIWLNLVLLIVLVVHLPETKKELKTGKCRLEIQTLFTEMNLICFQHDMAYGKSKDLTKRTQSDKVLR